MAQTASQTASRPHLLPISTPHPMCVSPLLGREGRLHVNDPTIAALDLPLRDEL